MQRATDLVFSDLEQVDPGSIKIVMLGLSGRLLLMKEVLSDEKLAVKY